MNELDQFSFMDEPSQAVASPAQLGANALDQFAFMDEEADYTIGEYLQQAGSSFVGGLSGTFTSAIEGLGIAVEGMTGESSIDDWARETQESINNAVPGVMGLQNSWTAKVSGAFGSAGGFVLASAATGGLGGAVGKGLSGVSMFGRAALTGAEAVAAGAKVAQATQLVTAGSLGALGNAAARYDEALMLGKSEEDAWKSYFVGMGIGSLEAMPVGLNRAAMRLGRVNKASGGALRNLTVGQVMLAEGLEEAGQEMLSEGLNQLSDYALSIKSAEEAFDFQQLLESGVLGFLPGSAIGGLTARSTIAANLAEERKKVEAEEEAKLTADIAKQREEFEAQKIGVVEESAKQAQELVAAGETELARLQGPAEAVAGAEPTPVGTPEEIAVVEQQLEQARKNRDVLVEQLRAVTAAPTQEEKLLQAGAYGQAQARAEQAGMGEQFRAATTPGAERVLAAEEQAAWDEKKATWAKAPIFKEKYNGAKNAKLVVAATTEQQNAEKILTDLGVKVEFVDFGNDDLTLEGIESGDTIFLNARLSNDAMLRKVARHEAFHSIFGGKEGRNLWLQTMKQLSVAAPNVWAAAREKAFKELASTKGTVEALNKALKTPEGADLLLNEQGSSAADIFSATIDALEANPALAEEVMQADPTFFQKLLDWVKTKLNRLGFKYETLADADRKAIEKLPKLLYATQDGEVEVEAGANERIAGAQVLMRLLKAAEEGTVAAASGRERQARVFATRTLGELEAGSVIDAKRRELLEKEEAEVRAKYEERRKRVVEAARKRLARVKPSDEEWQVIDAVGAADTEEAQLAAIQSLPGLPSGITDEELRSYVQVANEVYDRNQEKEARQAEAAEKSRQSEERKATAAEQLRVAQEAAYKNKLTDLRAADPKGNALGQIRRLINAGSTEEAARSIAREYAGKKATADQVDETTVALLTAAENLQRKEKEAAEAKAAAAQKRKDDAAQRKATEEADRTRRQEARAREQRERLERRIEADKARRAEIAAKQDEMMAQAYALTQDKLEQQRLELAEKTRVQEAALQVQREKVETLKSQIAQREALAAKATEEADKRAKEQAVVRAQREKVAADNQQAMLQARVRAAEAAEARHRESMAMRQTELAEYTRLREADIAARNALLQERTAARAAAEQRLAEAKTEAERKQAAKEAEAAKAAQEATERDAQLAAEEAKKAEERQERKRQKLPAVVAGRTVPGQLRVGDIVMFRNRAAKVVEATGSGLDQRVKLRPITDAENQVAMEAEEAGTKDWWNTVPFLGEAVTVDMNDPRITTRIAKRSDVEVLTEDGKKMFERRLEADVARREGDEPRFSVKGRITPEIDAAYLDAVERGDLDTAQQMVDEAAKAAGYDVGPVKHGTATKFTKFDSKFGGKITEAISAKSAFFLTDDDKTAMSYAVYAAEDGPVKEALDKAYKAEKRGDWDTYEKYALEAELLDAYDSRMKLRKNARIINAYIKGDFLEFDAEGKTPQELRDGDIDAGVFAEIRKAKRQGKTGVVYRNLDDAMNLANRPATHYAVFRPSQIKSADPITRDEDGRVIPLSERFNEATDDIRFSVRGRELTPEEREQLVSTAVAFAGGGTFEIALADYINPKIAVEANEGIATAYNTNAYTPARVAKLGDVSPEDFIGQTFFHASPPCVTSSKLRDGQTVSREEETARGREVAEIIRVAKNPIVVIENVSEYRKTEAFKLIAEALDEVGYTWDAQVYKAQDFGSPSRRQRMFVRAVREGALPPAPIPTHASKPSLYEEPFVSWGDTIADLLPTLPEFEGPLPPYVLKSLAAQGINPKSPSKAYYISGTQLYGAAPLAAFDQPSPTIVASEAETPRILMPDGRVLRVTPEAMKRLMGFGSEFVLPENQKLAKRIVGNGIPKQLTRALVVPVLESQGYQSREDMFSVKGRITPEIDAAYLAAVESGDLDTAQRMVDEAAKAAGLDVVRVYHGTKRNFTSFNPAQRDASKLSYFSYDKEFARRYASGTGGHRTPEPEIAERINRARLLSKQFFKTQYDALVAKYGSLEQAPDEENSALLTKTREYEKTLLDGMTISEAGAEMGIRVLELYLDTGRVFNPRQQWKEYLPEVLQYLQAFSWESLRPDMQQHVKNGNYMIWEAPNVVNAVLEKYDSILLQESTVEQKLDTIAVRDPRRIKSADPVTRDEDGRVIPLSERFNEANDDIRFSAKGKGKPASQKPATRVSATEAKRAAAELKKAQARAERSRLKTLRESMRRVEGLAAIAEKGGEGTDIGEAPGTAIAGATEEGRAYTRALREDMADIRDQILPDLKADDEARAEAVAKLDADYEGTKRQLYDEITETGNVSEPWKVYATMVIAAREAEAATTGRMTVNKYLAAYEAEAYDAIVKRAASAGLRVRKDSVMSARKRNKAHLFAETSSLRREMRKLRKAIDTGNKKQRDAAEKKIAEMRQQHAEAVVEFLDSMQQQGYDIDDMYSYLAKGDVVSFSRLARGAADARVRTDLASGRVQSAWDGLMEIRLASMLSGMGTHVANITGNAAMQTLRTTRQLAEVLTNMVYRDPNSADYGDFKAYMTGWLRSLSRATRNFVMAYRTDMPVFEVELSAEAASEFANQTNAIPGIIGRILRFPSLTTLRAFDEFFKTMAAYTETASLAYRDGRSKGISGPALESYIDGVLVNYNDPLWQVGLDRALETVFQGKGDKLTRILLSTREYLNNNPTTVPIGTYLLPFIKTPLQIFKVGLSMPIHPVLPLMRWINTLRGIEYTKAQQVTDSANALIAAGMMMLAYGLLGDDDDDEVAATGAAPDEYTERELMARVAPAYSIKGPGGDWYSYARIEPFATAFSAMVDLSRAQQRLMRDDVPDKWSQSFGIVLNNALGQIEDKTFLRTVGDVAKMVRDREQINVARFAKDLFVTPMIPNLVRQQVGASDPYVRNTSVREYEDVSAWEAAMQVVSFQVYPDANRPDAPPIKYDLWGRSIEKPGRSELARNFSPAKLEYQEEDIHKLDRLIVTFNDKVEDGKFGGDVQKYLPRAVEYRIKRDDKEYLLTKEEYARVSKEAGEKAAQRLQYRRLNYDDPTERDIEVIKEQISKSRKLIIDRVLRERRLTQNQTPQNP